MILSSIDIIIIVLFLTIILMVGIWSSRKSGKSSTEYFLSGRQMPWWILGISMVATTFSTDTPNLVTDIVRQNGVAGNWVWWAFLLTGMLTVFVYAKLWRRSGINTDLEFYELRYGGKGAGILRGFRAVYLGIAFNVLAMSGVILAAIKIGEIMLGFSPLQTVGIASVITLVFSVLGGFRGVVLTDMILFVIAMVGAIGAAIVAVNLPEVGGLSALTQNADIVDKLAFIPDPSDKKFFFTIFLIPLAVQWWSAWYPGAEPGGGGYIAQRMLAARDENHALGATLLFNVAHYALRPWPWILVALSSLLIFPELSDIQAAFPGVSGDRLGHDLAYPAMLTFLPVGLLGLVLASLMAAFMSTISTHLNWGSSYIVFDFYKRFIDPDASEKRLVLVGRLTTVLLMILATIFALMLTNAKELFDIILMFGAGTGLIFILRWFWWRINIWSEISAMVISGVIALLNSQTSLFHFIPEEYRFPSAVLLTTVLWLFITFITPPESNETLVNFIKKIKPSGPGWKKVYEENNLTFAHDPPSIQRGILSTILGCTVVYSALFCIGNLLYGNYLYFIVLLIVVIVFTLVLYKTWNPKKA